MILKAWGTHLAALIARIHSTGVRMENPKLRRRSQLRPRRAIQAQNPRLCSLGRRRRPSQVGLTPAEPILRVENLCGSEAHKRRFATAVPEVTVAKLVKSPSPKGTNFE